MTLSVIERDDTVVLLKFHCGGPALLVEAVSDTTQRRVQMLPRRMMAAWLKRHGYEWVEGTQACWMKDKPGAST